MGCLSHLGTNPESEYLGHRRRAGLSEHVDCLGDLPRTGVVNLGAVNLRGQCHSGLGAWVQVPDFAGLNSNFKRNHKKLSSVLIKVLAFSVPRFPHPLNGDDDTGSSGWFGFGAESILGSLG